MTEPVEAMDVDKPSEGQVDFHRLQSTLQPHGINLDNSLARHPDLRQAVWDSIMALCQHMSRETLAVEIAGINARSLARSEKPDVEIKAADQAQRENRYFLAQQSFWIRAWQAPYQVQQVSTLFEAELSKIANHSGNLYHRLLPLVQSSGTGKSRLLDHAADSFFTIPVVLRPKKTSNGYPPGDTLVHKLLCRVPPDYVSKKAHLMNFLDAVFTECLQLLTTELASEPGDLAVVWKAYLDKGTNRDVFYDKVVQNAEGKLASMKTFNPKDDLAWADRIIETQRRLLDLSNHIKSRVSRPILIYFDEAHELANGVGLYALSSLFADLKMHTIGTGDSIGPEIAKHVVVITSTNLKISELAPAIGRIDPNMKTPSTARWIDLGEPQMPRPWCLTPRHVLWSQPQNGNLQTPLEARNFERICTIGRPLWSSFYRSLILQGQTTETAANEVVKLAMLKLGKKSDTNQLVCAASACRLGLDIQSTGTTREFAQQLVEQSGATALHISQNRQLVSVAYANEPILANASSEVHRRYPQSVIESLVHMLKRGHIERGVCGELLTKFSLMKAHDNALQKAFQPEISDVLFLKPVTLSSFLEELLGTRAATDVLSSYSWNAARLGDKSAIRLRDFAKSTTILSQWTKAAKVADVQKLQGLVAAVKYQVGVEGSTNMLAIDGFLVFTIDENQPMSAENLLAFCYQTKNRDADQEVPPRLNGTIKKWLTLGVTVVYLHHNIVANDEYGVKLKKASTRLTRSSVVHSKLVESVDTAADLNSDVDYDCEPITDPVKPPSGKGSESPLFYFRVDGINPDIISKNEADLLANARPAHYEEGLDATVLSEIERTLPRLRLLENLNI